MKVRHTAILLTAGLILSSPALADDNLNCEAYGNAAVAHQIENVQNKCGFTGGRWSDDYFGHVDWCKLPNVKMENLTTEDRARSEALEKCEAPLIITTIGAVKTRNETCDRYANGAIAAHNKNIQYKCGFTDGRFANDRQGHFDWCMSQTDEVVNAEAQTREDTLKACTIPASQQAGCELYAKAAVDIVPAHGEACRKDNGDPTIPELIDFCHRIGGFANAVKENQKLIAETEHCKKFPPKVIKRYDNPGGTWTSSNGAKKFLPIDVCPRVTENSLLGGKGFNFCGKDNADLYCRNHGYDKATDFDTYGISNPENVMSTYWQESGQPCHGNCSAFEFIVCEKL